MILGIDLTPRQLRELTIWYDRPIKKVGEHIYRIEGDKERDLIAYKLDQYNSEFLNNVRAYMEEKQIHRVGLLDLEGRREPRETVLFSDHKPKFSLFSPQI